jgi:hypothetical protein
MCIAFHQSLYFEIERCQTQNLTAAEFTCFSHAPDFSNTGRNVDSLQDNTYCHIKVTFTAHNHFKLIKSFLSLFFDGDDRNDESKFHTLPTENTQYTPMMDW